MIRREQKETIEGSVSAADVRDLIVFGLKACAENALIVKVEPFSEGCYVTFANGERFEINVNHPGRNTQRQRRDAALVEIKRIADALELPHA